MRVLLTVPPSKDTLTLEKDEDVAQGMGFFPPLGILYVGSYLAEHAPEHEVVIVDPDPEGLNVNALVQRVVESKPDVFGITTFTNTWKTVLDVLGQVKKALPSCTTVAGGPHLFLYPTETMQFDEVDYAINGDGEHGFTQFVQAIEANEGDALREELKRVPGIVMRDGDGSIFQNPYSRVEDLDSLPFPNLSLINTDFYFCILGTKRLMTTICSSRGCPFHCTYCNSPDKVHRARSAKNVVDEIEYCVENGIEEIFFFDDLFNLEKKRVFAICDDIIDRGLHKKMTWAFRGRVNNLTDESLVVRMREAGCNRAQLGIEKATNEALALVRKNITVDQIERAVSLLSKHGFQVVGNFILFTPGEDMNDAKGIVDFAMRLKLDHAEFNVFAPYPGSQIYDDGVASGFFEKDYWREFVVNPQNKLELLWEEKVPREEMFALVNEATRKFYFRPRIIFNEMKRVASWTDFWRKFKAGIMVLKLR